MIIKSVACTNTRGDSVTIGSRPYLLSEDIVLNGLQADIISVQGNQDGSTYVGSRLKERDIPITFGLMTAGLDKDTISDKRNQIFKVFNPAYNPINLTFEMKSGQTVYTLANVQSTPLFASGKENSNYAWQKCLVQLEANDPFLYDTETSKIDVAVWNSVLEFGVLELSADGTEIGNRSPSLIVNVLNDGQDKTGIIIQLRAAATVVNPSLVNVNTQEFFKLNTTMLGGDVITINTFKGKKRAELTRNNVVTNIFNTIDFESTFLQLDTGDNLFRYDAESGIDSLECSIYFAPKFLGV